MLTRRMERIFLFTLLLLSTFYVSAQPTVSPNPLTFPEVQPVGSPIIGLLQVSIANPGTQTLNISSATVTGDFSFGSNPPSQSVILGAVAAGTSVNFTMLFNATAAGPRAGTLALVDDAPGSPHTFQVSGTGFVGAMIQPRGAQLNLITDTLGTAATSVDQIVSVGNLAVTISNVGISGAGFSQTNDCTASLTQGQTCNVTVSFNPSTPGPQKGTLTIANTGTTNPVTVPLTGDAADFSLTFNPTGNSATVTAGQTATYFFALSSPDGVVGLNGIAFSCSGLPNGTMCTESKVNETSTGFAAQMAVSTTARTTASLHKAPPFWGWSLAVVSCLVFLSRGKPSNGKLSKRRGRISALSVTMLAALTAGSMISCGGSSSSNQQAVGTPAGTYSLTDIGHA